jgi:glycosyltransferase involved in cell wall biosynthesis
MAGMKKWSVPVLSVIIIVKNEERNIGRCLESVAWADELIVLDSGSTDATVEICRCYTDHVFVTDWPGFGLQKQRALDKASGDWVLSIDADEQVSVPLRREIEQAVKSDEINGYEIPRLSEYCGRKIHHGGWWPDYVLRLFRRSSGRFTDSIVHERVVVEGKVARLNTPLAHETYIDLEEVLFKVNSYSSSGAHMLYQKGVRTSLLQAVLRAMWTFLRTYLIKASILDGREGFMLAVSNAEGAYYKHLKLLELQKRLHDS